MDEIFEDLSPEEVKLFKRKIKEIEKEILRRVWNQVKVLAIIMAFVLTSGGIISFSGIRDSVINRASEKLKDDSKLRAKIITKIEKKITQNIQNDIDKVEELKSKVSGLSIDIEEAITQNVQNDIDEIEKLKNEAIVLTNDIEKEKSLAQEALSQDLRYIRKMLERIYADHFELLDTLGNGQ